METKNQDFVNNVFFFIFFQRPPVNWKREQKKTFWLSSVSKWWVKPYIKWQPFLEIWHNLRLPGDRFFFFSVFFFFFFFNPTFAHLLFFRFPFTWRSSSLVHNSHCLKVHLIINLIAMLLIRDSSDVHRLFYIVSIHVCLIPFLSRVVS